MRVDKWIWAVRMVKTRTLAGKLCLEGKVLVNDQKVKPSKILKLGDKVSVRKKTVVVYEVRGFLSKRVGAQKAKEFYEDKTPFQAKSVESFAQGRRDKGQGRPTKKDRRALEKVKYSLD